MTKETFLKIKDQTDIPMDVWFEYYRDRGGIIQDFDYFNQVFSTLLVNRATVAGSDGRMKEITLQSAYNQFYDYYSKKFNL